MSSTNEMKKQPGYDTNLYHYIEYAPLLFYRREAEKLHGK
jgi:hypothetical protein